MPATGVRGGYAAAPHPLGSPPRPEVTIRRLLLALLCLAFLAVSCDATLITIDVPYDTTTTVERSTVLKALVGDLGFGDFLEMDVTSSSELQNQGVAPGDINDVSLTFFRLSVVAPEGADMSFLDNLSLYVEAPDLDRVRVAVAPEFPTGASSVDFEIDDVDLTEYVVSQSMTLTTEVEGHRPAEDTELLAELELSVAVTGQGACSFIEASSAE